MNLDIEQKWHIGTAAPQVSFQRREQQKRQPGKQRDNDDALAHHHQRIVGQVRPAQKLEERAAQDERELGGIPQEIPTIGRFCCAGFHFDLLVKLT